MKTPAPSARGALALAALAFGALSHAGAATLPFSNDFSSSGLENNSGFTLGSGFQTLAATGTVTPVGVSTSQFSNATNASFTVTSRFRIESLGDSAFQDQAVGLALFGFNSTLGGTADSSRYILADWRFQGNSAGSLRLFEVDGTNTVLGTTGTADTNGGTAGVVTLNTLFTLKATITNTAANTYDISFGLFDADGAVQIGSSASTSIGYVASTEPSGGYYFGIRSRLPNSTGTTTVAFNDFAIAAIPEASTFAAFAGFGALGAAVLRRRAFRV